MEAQPAKKGQPLSPARSDKSSESEGRPVREKLKETRIDAQGTSGPVPAVDQAMHDAHTNGTAAVDPSTSGSDSERGRLRRKRSRENFEADENAESDQKPERHVRKKSRDIASPTEVGSDGTAPIVNAAAPPVAQKNGDDTMQPQNSDAAIGQGTPEAELSDKHADGVASPKNKRTREQAEAGAEAAASQVAESTKDSTAASGAEDERTTKRPRDAVGSNAAETAESKAKIPLGSGFANTSATSPFAAMAAKPQTSKAIGALGKDLPQTSSEAFKKSGFGALANAASPFAAASSGGSSPFGSAAGSKLSSFASPGKVPTAQSGFAALGSKPVQSSFGGFNSTNSPSGFAAVAKTSTAGGFGGFGSTSTKSSFGTGATITGLSQTTEKPFGSREEDEKSDDEDGDGDDEGDADSKDGAATEPRTSQPLLQSQPPPETGEENEETLWTGRAKLYKLVGEGSKKAWTERGVGPIKLNVTREEPIKARFVLRADGTHRLLLNAAVTAGLRFGNVEGKKPEDGRILFNTPTASGEVESYTLRMKAERATELWTTVEAVKKDL